MVALELIIILQQNALQWEQADPVYELPTYVADLAQDLATT